VGFPASAVLSRTSAVAGTIPTESNSTSVKPVRIPKTFPAAYYEHIYRLNNWDYNSNSSKRPGVIRHWTNDIICARLAPAVLEELKRGAARDEAARDEKGRLKHKLFQMLTPELGYPKLVDHFKEVLAIMRGGRNWAEFYDLLDRSLPRFNEPLQLPFYDAQAMERLPQPPQWPWNKRPPTERPWNRAGPVCLGGRAHNLNDGIGCRPATMTTI
jgi:hypothetical protein